MQSAIEIQGLIKHFGQITALDGIDFTVNQGELFGFLGPNGAGKTTTINVLTGLARPDSGTICVGGIDCTDKSKAAQHLIGVVPDDSNLYPELTGFENLCFCGSLHGMAKDDRTKRARELLERFGLAEAAGRRFAGYSRGMKRKLTIAAGIIHSPAILFLDEPTTGIDVASARQIRKLIADMNHDGTTIFLTTHYIEEAERLCKRIAFIVAGKLLQIDTLENLMQPLTGQYLVDFTLSAPVSGLEQEVLQAFPQLRPQALENDRFRLASKQAVPIGPLVRFFEDKGLEVTEARRVQPSLEEVFVQITGIEAAAIKREKEKGAKIK